MAQASAPCSQAGPLELVQVRKPWSGWRTGASDWSSEASWLERQRSAGGSADRLLFEKRPGTAPHVSGRFCISGKMMKKRAARMRAAPCEWTSVCEGLLVGDFAARHLHDGLLLAVVVLKRVPAVLLGVGKAHDLFLCGRLDGICGQKHRRADAETALRELCASAGENALSVGKNAEDAEVFFTVLLKGPACRRRCRKAPLRGQRLPEGVS